MLGIRANATGGEIDEAYRRKLEALQAEEARLGFEEFEYRQRLLRSAHDMLSDPLARLGYDEKLMARRVCPGVVAVPQTNETSVGSTMLARRAEALSLRADALSLRADALSMHTDSLAGGAGNADEPPWGRAFQSFKSSFRSVAFAIGVVAIILAVIRLLSVGMVSRSLEATAESRAKADDKAVIQEFYQTYGYRPASAEEARLLERQHQEREREEQEAARKQQREEEDARRFQEDARRLGQQVSEDLHAAEERNRREALYEKERQEAQQQMKEERERERLEREQQRWRDVLTR